mmetsp:Transcript_12805/g.17788  ORF Transcript_12805/g.17788 Transcript_12805/m.17788 type:complete len:241 (+) Transcript_12805:25-747(+)
MPRQYMKTKKQNTLSYSYISLAIFIIFCLYTASSITFNSRSFCTTCILSDMEGLLKFSNAFVNQLSSASDDFATYISLAIFIIFCLYTASSITFNSRSFCTACILSVMEGLLKFSSAFLNKLFAAPNDFAMSATAFPKISAGDLPAVGLPLSSEPEPVPLDGVLLPLPGLPMFFFSSPSSFESCLFLFLDATGFFLFGSFLFFTFSIFAPEHTSKLAFTAFTTSSSDMSSTLAGSFDALM